MPAGAEVFRSQPREGERGASGDDQGNLCLALMHVSEISLFKITNKIMDGYTY